MNHTLDLALAELGGVVKEIDQATIDKACNMLTTAQNIVLYGCGREGLQMRGFAMRLYHLGLKSTMQGDMATPPVGKNDLLVVSDGPGHLSTVSAFVDIAVNAGAGVLLLTAQPDAPIGHRSDLVLHIPAQTMTRVQEDSATSKLPMGSLYEGALFLLFEIMILRLQHLMNESEQNMRARHTNLE